MLICNVFLRCAHTDNLSYIEHIFEISRRPDLLTRVIEYRTTVLKISEDDEIDTKLTRIPSAKKYKGMDPPWFLLLSFLSFLWSVSSIHFSLLHVYLTPFCSLSLSLFSSLMSLAVIQNLVLQTLALFLLKLSAFVIVPTQYTALHNTHGSGSIFYKMNIYLHICLLYISCCFY